MTWEQFNLETVLRLNKLCDAFEESLQRGENPDPASYVEGTEAEREVLLRHFQEMLREYRGISRDEFCHRLIAEGLFPDGVEPTEWNTSGSLAEHLVLTQSLTKYQAETLLQESPVPLRLDNYLILDCIASGGMGTVYKATHTLMNRVVALKTITAGSNLQERLPWLLHEAQAAARLTHPHVVTAYDAGQARGVVYLVSEYVEGRDLHLQVAEQGPMPEAEVISIIRQAALGLGSIHQAGLIHRDVKPSNLIRTTSGVVRVLDVGLAQEANQAKPAILAGTPGFMAPEQLGNLHPPDVRSDVYSLGATAYYLLTAQLMTTPDCHTMLPGKIAHLIQQMTAADPDQRLASMSAVLDELNHLDRPATRNVWAYVLAIFLALSICVGIVVVFWSSRQTETLPSRLVALELPYNAASHQKRWATGSGRPIEIEPISGLKARLIPPGTGNLGTAPDDLRRLYAHLTPEEQQFQERLEAPRRFTLKEAIYLGITEVTVAQFRQFVEAQRPPYITEAERPDGVGFRLQLGVWSLASNSNWRIAGDQPVTDEHPVFNLSRNDAADFCRWVTRQLEGQYLCRLPSDLEWEYACRAGSSGQWSVGNQAEDLPLVAWFQQTVEPEEPFIRPVARKQPNAFGLFDMHGNLEEWCSSTIEEQAAVLCGGNIRSSAVGLRCAARSASPPTAPRGGFRIVLVPTR